MSCRSRPLAARKAGDRRQRESYTLMKRSPKAPPGASKRARVPHSDRAHSRKPHPEEGPAPSRAPEAPPSAADPAAREPPEPPGSTPSPLFPNSEAVHAWHPAARDALLDLAAAARDAVRRPKKRVLSRAEIRRQARAAFAQAT